MLINELKELRAYVTAYGASLVREDSLNPKGEKVVIVRFVDAYGCAWRTGKGKTTREAWADLVNKVFSAARHPRKK